MRATVATLPKNSLEEIRVGLDEWKAGEVKSASASAPATTSAHRPASGGKPLLSMAQAPIGTSHRVPNLPNVFGYSRGLRARRGRRLPRA